MSLRTTRRSADGRAPEDASKLLSRKRAGSTPPTSEVKHPKLDQDAAVAAKSDGSTAENSSTTADSQPVTQHPAADTDNDVSTINIDYIPSNVLPRVRIAMAHAIAKHNRHPIANIISGDTGWGGTGSRWLLFHGKIVTALFVAQIRRTSFFTMDNGNKSPGRYASIRFRFIREVDDTNGRVLTYGASKPPSTTVKRTFRASCPTCRGPETYFFKEVYDGTTKFKAKALMEHLTYDAIKPNDICLIEARIQRWDSAKRKGWEHDWASQLHLEAITKLYAAPDDLPEDVESDDDEPRAGTDEEFEGF
ncbi:hypothetical protein NM688_g7791 [Phlebia brevispora]|uniref:Uncharacterized protein n=1 Tax=Phlebia brevispora TaxID=194682 RepID=A0ACC1S1D7_9APHY|nr:hypothetical protein NM688_g7791 [Phlebia brevispora]